MSDQLPRLGGLPEPEKYERLVERVPGVWWSDAGPFAGLHELNALRAEYFRRVFGGFGGKRVLDVGCGGGILDGCERPVDMAMDGRGGRGGWVFTHVRRRGGRGTCTRVRRHLLFSAEWQHPAGRLPALRTSDHPGADARPVRVAVGGRNAPGLAL